jgi:hypothetical protein
VYYQKLFVHYKLSNKSLAYNTKKPATTFLFALGILVLSVGSGIWVISCVDSIKQYEIYFETITNQGVEHPIAFYSWESGRIINITLIALFFLWVPFIDHSLRKMLHPFLKKKLTINEAKRFSRSVSRSIYEEVYRLVFGYFKKVNHKVKAKISLWFMKLETFEHVHMLTRVFKWIVFPANVIYGSVMLIFLRQNALGSIILASLLFFYSNFVPDLPAIFRKKVYHDIRDTFHKELPKYKTYVLLLVTPVFIILLFCGKKIKWETTETFHNFKSLTMYVIFMFSVGFLVLITFPFTVRTTIEVLWVPLFALLGYLTHLKVDEVF